MVISRPEFWNSLKFIYQLEKPTSMKQICEELGVLQEDVKKVVLFLNYLNQNFIIDKQGEGEYIIPDKRKEKVQFEMSVLEWIAFQSHFPLFESTSEKPFHQMMASKLGEIEEEHSHLDLFKAEDSIKQHFAPLPEERKVTAVKTPQEHKPKFQGESKEICSIAEQAILDKSLVAVELKGESFHIFPYILVHLEGELSLVGEETVDKCLTYFKLKDISSIKIDEFKKDHQANFSILEVYDFISSIRQMNDSEIRLILKVNSQNEQDLNPLYHHLGRPYIVSNPDGDLIWAAFVEPCDDLHMWIRSLGDKVEILDPQSFKDEYAHYCTREQSKKKAA